MNRNCCAVVISYNPTKDILVNIDTLIAQVSEVIIVDNGSEPKSLAILAELNQQPKVRIRYNTNNLGIATALNQGIRFAIDRGYEWVMTLDQDSLAPTDFILTMFDAYMNCDDREFVAIIAPRYQMNNMIKSFSTEKGKYSFSKIKTTITSGNLVKIDTFQKVGFFDDSFFIDYVDHEFCLRVRSCGLLIIESHNSVLKHNLGDSSTHEFMKLKLITTSHSPLRRYYKYRNMVKTFKKYYWFEPLMLIIQFRALLIEPVKIALWETNKFAKISSICKGFLDGALNRDS